MESKLQELTSRIYNEGIEKANQEAAEILENAKKEAEKIVETAKKEAEKIQEQTRHETDELRKNVGNEVKMSARQSIAAIKQQITGLITASLVKEPVKAAVSDKDFLKKIIEAVIKNWDPKSGAGLDLAVILPKEDEKTLGSYFQNKTHELLKGGLKVEFDDKMSGGFRIGPGDKSYVLSFTDEDFGNFFKNYLRPRTTKLLYGGE
jgi:V/A-type H+/Na+-transporting ATPase subunit E